MAIEVELPSGALFEVLTEEEADFTVDLARRYTEAFEFEHISDIQDLDKVVTLEVLCHRWRRWLGSTTDYEGKAVDQVDLYRRVKDFDAELRGQKKALGIDAVTRDKAKGEGSIPHFVATMREKARIFGVHREHQLDRALELTNQLISLVTVWRNCVDDDERRLLHHTTDDIIDWITNVYTPEYQEIDAHFRAHEQKYWVRDL